MTGRSRIFPGIIIVLGVGLTAEGAMTMFTASPTGTLPVRAIQHLIRNALDPAARSARPAPESLGLLPADSATDPDRSTRLGPDRRGGPTFSPDVRTWVKRAAEVDSAELRRWLGRRMLAMSRTQGDSVYLTLRRFAPRAGFPWVTTLRATYVKGPRHRLHLVRVRIGPPGFGTSAAPVPQPPAGIAAAALADTAFDWIHRTTDGLRVYFQAGSYAAARQDSMIGRLRPAVEHAREMIGAPALEGPVDVFFLETRQQMTRLMGGRATGFAEPSTRTVLLVTNPAWRAFERHEIMHVVAGQSWGPIAADAAWLLEGLAQAADGRCGAFSNTDVMLALNVQHGWIPFETMLTRFREQSDLRAYLQAASFVEYLLQTVGPDALEIVWRRGATAQTPVDGRALGALERTWRGQLRADREVPPEALAVIEDKGCG